MLEFNESDFEELSLKQGEKAVSLIKEKLPEDIELALHCFTGSRAFGWGSDHHDIDFRGFFVGKDWFDSLHLGEHIKVGSYDMTIQNIESFQEPEIWFDSWNTYVDTTNPIFIHEDFDYDDFRNHLEPENIVGCYPFNIENQLKKLEIEWTPRTALHSYKEVMYPLNYLWHEDMELNVMKINKREKFRLEGLPPCREAYYNRNPFDESYKEVVDEEVWNLFEKIGEELERRDIDH